MAASIVINRGAGLAFGLLLTLLAYGNAPAQGEESTPSIPPLGPLDTPFVLEEQRLTEKNNFSLTGDYQVVGQKASDSLGEEDDAFGGIGRLIGSWQVWQDTTHPGGLFVRLETRDALGTDLAPEELGPVSLGYVGLTAADYSNIGLGYPELFWKQQFLTKTPVEVRVGRLAPAAYFDVTAFSDQLTSFMNLSIILSPTVPYPSGGSLGAVGYVGLTNNLYLLGTALDANGEWDGSGDIDKGEFFTGLEFGWTKQGTGKGEPYLFDNVHVSYWHRDAIEDAGTGSGQGVSLTISGWYAERGWGGFLRAGWAEGNVSLIEKSAAVGVATHVTERNDYTGVAVSWGQAFNSDVDQVTTEAFYRFNLTKNLAITPNIQLLIDPANNPGQDEIWIAGLRVRLAP